MICQLNELAALASQTFVQLTVRYPVVASSAGRFCLGGRCGGVVQSCRLQTADGGSINVQVGPTYNSAVQAAAAGLNRSKRVPERRIR
eukprot:scaffold152152_cov14-Prasinocladus_malaysianus.AAC.1